MTTTILGAQGKLGAMLAHFADASGLGWQSGTLNDLGPEGGTVINMVGKSIGDATALHASNVRYVQDLLIKATDAGVAHVVLASSAAVYGKGNGHTFTEGHPFDPLTPYAVSKTDMECIAGSGEIPTITILRIANVAGADALYAAAKSHVEAGTPMQLHRLPNGTAPVRSYIGPRDLFRTVRDVCINVPLGLRVLNVAHPQPITLDALLEGYKTHLLPALTWADIPLPKGIPLAVTLSADKVQHFVNYDEYPDAADAFAQQAAEYLLP